MSIGDCDTDNMMVTRRASRGVFCLEGPWSTKLTDRSTVRPLLEVADRQVDAKFIFRDVATEPETRQYLRQWTQKQYQSYSIGMFSFHGRPGRIELGRRVITLDALGEMLEGRCRGRLLHFDSCEVLNVLPKQIEQFRQVTGASAVSGFTRSVDWLESAAFTLNYLNYLMDNKRVSTALKHLKADHPGACNNLGFRAVWDGGRVGIPGRHS